MQFEEITETADIQNETALESVEVTESHEPEEDEATEEEEEETEEEASEETTEEA